MYSVWYWKRTGTRVYCLNRNERDTVIWARGHAKCGKNEDILIGCIIEQRPKNLRNVRADVSIICILINGPTCSTRAREGTEGKEEKEWSLKCEDSVLLSNECSSVIPVIYFHSSSPTVLSDSFSLSLCFSLIPFSISIPGPHCEQGKNGKVSQINGSATLGKVVIRKVKQLRFTIKLYA